MSALIHHEGKLYHRRLNGGQCEGCTFLQDKLACNAHALTRDGCNGEHDIQEYVKPTIWRYAGSRHCCAVLGKDDPITGAGESAKEAYLDWEKLKYES